MRKFALVSIAVALFLGLVSAGVCDSPCTSSADCADAGTCRLCIDGTCQHRCAFHQSDDVNFLGAACGDTCSSSSECTGSPDCRLCIEGTCQHRCMNEFELPYGAVTCGDACTSSSDCAAAGDCRLCISGTCQHRCEAGEEEMTPVDPVTPIIPVSAAQCGD